VESHHLFNPAIAHKSGLERRNRVIEAPLAGLITTGSRVVWLQQAAREHHSNKKWGGTIHRPIFNFCSVLDDNRRKTIKRTAPIAGARSHVPEVDPVLPAAMAAPSTANAIQGARRALHAQPRGAVVEELGVADSCAIASIDALRHFHGRFVTLADKLILRHGGQGRCKTGNKRYRRQSNFLHGMKSLYCDALLIYTYTAAKETGNSATWGLR
jgi:hypothetical protein